MGAAKVGVTLVIRTAGAARRDCAPSPPAPEVFLSTSPPMVVRRIGPALTTGADRGLRTDVFQSSAAFTLPTIRRAWEAENMEFSLGGDPALVAVGLRRRWTRIAVLFPPFKEELRFNAERMVFASEASTGQADDRGFPSSSDDELLLPTGVISGEVVATTCRELRCGALLISISRSGDCSESEELL